MDSCYQQVLGSLALVSWSYPGNKMMTPGNSQSHLATPERASEPMLQSIIAYGVGMAEYYSTVLNALKSEISICCWNNLEQFETDIESLSGVC